MDDFGPDLSFIFDDASGLMDFDVLNSFKIHETKDSKNNLNGEKEDHESNYYNFLDVYLFVYLKSKITILHNFLLLLFYTLKLTRCFTNA